MAIEGCRNADDDGVNHRERFRIRRCGKATVAVEFVDHVVGDSPDGALASVETENFAGVNIEAENAQTCSVGGDSQRQAYITQADNSDVSGSQLEAVE